MKLAHSLIQNEGTDCQTVTVLVLHMRIHVHSMLVGLGNTALAVSVPIPRSGDPNFLQGINEADERRKEKKRGLDADP